MVIILAIVTLWMLSGVVRGSKAHNAKIAEAPILEVAVMNSVAQPRAEVLRINGVTEASEVVQVRAKIDGLIKEIPVKQGQFLKKDDVIITMDLQNRPQGLREAEALLRRQKVAYDSAKAIYQKQLGSEISLADAEANLRSAENKFKLAQDQLENAFVRAPFDGYVDTINIRVGDFASTFANAELAKFINLNPIFAVTGIPETAISNIDVAKKAKVIFRDNQILEGEITFLSKVADPSTRTYRTEVSLANADYKIFSGETVRMEVLLEEYNAHLIPKSALSLTSSGEMQAKIVDEDNKVISNKIRIIDENRDGFWVTGLPDKAKIITLGHQYAKDGEQVIVNVTKS